MGLLKNIFGTGDVVKKGLDLIDDIWTTDIENLEAKTKAKKELLQAYAPFKLTQRYIALTFTFIFAFIMLNGVLGLLYGLVDINKVKTAMEFANEMWLGQLVAIIVTFYFGGGFAESLIKKKKEDK